MVNSQTVAADSVAAHPPTSEITLQRLDDHRWRASYQFSAPIEALAVYPAGLSFRERAWEILTPEAQLHEETARGVIRASGGAFDRLDIGFSSQADFDAKTYVPVLPFSDGGAAVYTGHFSGDVMWQGEFRTSRTRFRLAGRTGEHTVLPAWASESQPVYVYFGPAPPLEAEQAILIADPHMPPWLLESFTAAVPAATGVYARRLEHHLADKPLVLIAAGELEDFEGYSVKGGGLDGQFTVMLRGAGLLAPSEERRRMFEKLVAHELLHVWQQSMPGGQANDAQPWLHEGSAEALAVAALVEAGLWSAWEAAEFHATQARACAESGWAGDLAAAAAADDWGAIYACGYLEFSEGVDDPFLLWRELTSAAAKSGEPYSQALLEQLR